MLDGRMVENIGKLILTETLKSMRMENLLKIIDDDH